MLLFRVCLASFIPLFVDLMRPWSRAWEGVDRRRRQHFRRFFLCHPSQRAILLRRSTLNGNKRDWVVTWRSRGLFLLQGFSQSCAIVCYTYLVQAPTSLNWFRRWSCGSFTRIQKWSCEIPSPCHPVRIWLCESCARFQDGHVEL